MWNKLPGYILRNRILILSLLGIITLYMGYRATEVKLQYGLPQLLPDTDTTVIQYADFRERFGEEKTVVVFGIEKNPLEHLELFNDWFELTESIKAIKGVDTVLSLSSIYSLEKDTENKRFYLNRVIKNKISTTQELDSIRNLIEKLPFYEGIFYNRKTDATLMAMSINPSVFNSKNREKTLLPIMALTDAFSQKHQLRVYYSGLPYIRTIVTGMIKSELKMFIILAILVTVLILMLFFRSFQPMLVSMLVVALGVIWSMGNMAILGYEITILTSIIPPLIIVIGIPNCIFLINKYHSEYTNHGNKAKALSRVIQKIGKATLLTNATTAVGFLTFIFTNSKVLAEFGVIASLGIMLLFLFSILLIPIIFSYLPHPTEKQTSHLDKKFITKVIDVLVGIVEGHRTKVYWVTGILALLALFGITKINTTGNIVDDLPHDHYVREELHFFESNFNGIMPFEVSIDAQKPNMILQSGNLKKMEKIHAIFQEYPEFSRPVSVVDGIKFTKQAFYNSNPEKYQLLNEQEKAFFKPYIETAKGDREFLKSFMDTTKQYARINVQVADVGTMVMAKLVSEIKSKIDSIMPPDKYTVALTGSSVVYLKGTEYLVHNLFVSLAIAIVIVSIIMAMLFSSFKMILISITTNFIPLLLTASLMGFFGITIKPSTILVFSIAFGISVDDTIHFLAKFKQELKAHDWVLKSAVLSTLKETGISMFYTSIILFAGFSVFASSSFGGTKALGILVSFTLFVAMFANLILLPSFLLTMDKRETQKAFAEPLLEIYDEEEDIDTDQLTIKTEN
jgi:predicted RND superfamily exporter protein